MNFRSTGYLFAALLTVLWAFGLMTAWKKTVVEEAFVLPSLKAAFADYDIDRVVVRKAEKDKEATEYAFVPKGELWKAKVGEQTIGVESFRVRDLVEQVRDARRDEEANVPNDPAASGMNQPMLTITLSGHPKDKRIASFEKQWTLRVGSLSPDKKLAYVSTSDQPNRIVGVPRSSLKAVFFEDLRSLRPLRLFNANTPSVKHVEIFGDDRDLQIDQGSDGLWRIAKPNLGLAEEEGPPAPKGTPPEAKPSAEGVRGLIDAILSIRVSDVSDHLVPPVDPAKYGLQEGRAALSISVSGDAKDTRETLLIGNAEGDSRYARLGGDEGVFRIPAKLTEPILKALQTPEKLRSTDVSGNETRGVDAVVIRQGGDETTLLKKDDKNWTYRSSQATHKASVDAVRTLLDALQGRREIKEFLEGDGKKIDEAKGLNDPKTSIALYADGTAKDDKGNATLKKEVRPVFSLAFGSTEGNRVNVKRTSGNIETRFQVEKRWLDLLLPSEGKLAFLDRDLPEFGPTDVERATIERGGRTVNIERNDKGSWIVREGKETAPADSAKIFRIFTVLSHPTVGRWVQNMDAKTNIEPFGLKSPSTVASFTLKRHSLSPQGAAAVTAAAFDPVGGIASALAANLSEPGETIVFRIGKETTEGAQFGTRSGVDRIFTLTPDFAKLLGEDDFRDRLALAIGQPVVAASSAGLAAAGIEAVSWNFVVGQIHHFDSTAASEIRMAIRTPVELRTLHFKKTDKTWKDASGLQEFSLDSAKVDQLVELIAQLRTPRIVSIGSPSRKDQKLDAKEATVRIEAVFGSETVTLTIGSRFDPSGYFAQSSAWPHGIFLVPNFTVETLLRGPSQFAAAVAAQQ
ncbi:MAG: DUF4340 domain-containing protein [Gemmataceae bacterium]|nr:DUF4340 domain-containing protein [Gemmataceae bacterium]